MGKIGILTYFNYINYGSMLQGYATQKALQKFLDSENDCILINYRYLAPVNRSILSIIKLRIKRIWYYISNIREVFIKFRYSEKLNKKNRLFDSFRDNYTIVTDTFYRDKKQLESNPPVFDVYVTGSDQTWSPKVSGGYFETPMFLDFAIKGSRKCAYAPSIGNPNLSEDDKKTLKAKLNDFEIISCRETGGTKLLEEITKRNVKKVLDPTLLLSENEWRSISVMPKIKTDGYILCYFLGDRDYYRKFAEQLSVQLTLPIYYIPASWKDCRTGNNLLFDVGPKEFIGLIDNAKIILTDSFHGTAFSSNLNKNFYSFVKHSGGKKSGDNSRLFDYLSLLSLESRLLEDYKGGLIEIEDIDYTSVNKLLSEKRAESLEVIKMIVEVSKR